MARLYQKISANIVLIGAFFGLLWCLVYFTVNSTFAWEVFDGLVNRLFSGRIGFSRVSWGPLPWQVKVLEPVLIDPRGQVVVEAREVHASVDLTALLEGNIFADDVVVRGAVMNLVERPFGDPEKKRTKIFTIEEVFRPPVWEPDDGVPGQPPHLRFHAALVEARYVQDIPGARLQADGAVIRNGYFELDARRPAPIRMGAESAEVRRVDLMVGGPEVDAPLYRWVVTDFAVSQFRWPSASLAGDGLDAARATFRVGGDPFEIQGFKLGLSGPGLPFLHAHVKATLADVAPHLAPFGVDFLRGPVTLELQGEGEIDSFDGRFRLAGPDLRVFEWRATDWSVAGGVRNNAVTLERLDTAALGGRVQVEGAFDLERARGHAFVRLAGVRPDLAPVPLPSAVAPLVAGVVTGRLGASVVDAFSPTPRASADADLVLERRGAGPYGLPPRTALQVAATYGPDRAVRVHSLDVRPGEDRVTARGEIDLDGRTLDVRGQAQITQVSRYLQTFGLDLAGRVGARFRARGALASPTIEGDVDGDGVQFADFPPAAVEARARFAGGRLHLDPATVTTASGTATARGVLDLVRPGTPLDLRVGARAVDLEALPLPVDVGGQVDAEVAIAGPAARPRLSGRVAVRAPRWQQLQFERLEAAGSFAGDAVKVEDLRLADAKGERVALSGEVSLSKASYRARGRLTDIPLDVVNRFVEAPLPIRGTLNAEIDGEGTFADPRGEGKVELTGVGWDVYEGGDATLRVKAEDHVLSASGQLFGLATLDAAVPTLPGGLPARATLLIDGLDLHERLPQLAKAGVQLRLAGKIDATADVFAGELQEVKVDLSRLRLSTPQITLENDGAIAVSLRHGVVNLDRLQLQTRGQRVAVSGTMGMAGDLDVRLVGDLDLGIVAPFVQDTFTHLDGAAALDINLQGNVFGQYLDVTPDGHVRLHHARMTPRSSVVGSELVLSEPCELLVAPPQSEGYGPAMKPGTFEVRLADTRTQGANEVPNRLVVRRDEGEIRITELRLSFDDFLPGTLYTSLDATGVRLVIPGTMRATIDASDLVVAITGLRQLERGQINVSGDVNVARGDYTADLLSTSDLTGGVRQNLSAVSRAQQISVFERVPLLQRLYVDLNITGDNDIFVRNNVAVFELDLEIRPQLRVRGFLYSSQDTREEDQLTLEGSVETVRETSKIVYASREFDVNSGRVDFGRGSFLEGSVEANHVFRIATNSAATGGGGATEYEQAEVILAVSFRIPFRGAKPELELSLNSSSGAYSQSDLATLVATGRLPSDVSGAASAQPALELALGPVLGLIERPLEETLDLDRVQFTPISTGALVIEADKELSRRLRLYSSTPVGEGDTESTRTFGLTYQLNNYLFGELKGERVDLVDRTTGNLRLHLSFD